MFKYFFICEDQLPTDVGFLLFSMIHIRWLAVIIVSGFFAVMGYKMADDVVKIKCEKSMAISMVGLDLCKDVVLIVTGNFHVWELPLNMCGLALYVSLIHAFTHTKTTWEILYCLGMPGALAALLFPNWNSYPQINFMNIYSFLTHGLIVIYPLMLLFSGRWRPNIRNYIRVWIFLAVVIPVAWIVNERYKINFLFLNTPSKGSPLVSIYNLTGDKWYLVGFAVTILIVNLIMYVPFIISDLRKNAVIR